MVHLIEDLRNIGTDLPNGDWVGVLLVTHRIWKLWDGRYGVKSRAKRIECTACEDPCSNVGEKVGRRMRFQGPGFQPGRSLEQIC